MDCTTANSREQRHRVSLTQCNHFRLSLFSSRLETSLVGFGTGLTRSL